MTSALAFLLTPQLLLNGVPNELSSFPNASDGIDALGLSSGQPDESRFDVHVGTSAPSFLNFFQFHLRKSDIDY
jgi:hypothetical protein